MLTIVRGLPGSGKSTYAKKIGCVHFEADMFHFVDGVYRWSGDRVKQAHAWCYDMVTETLKRGVDVVVSNTFTQYWEMEKYINFCVENGIPYKVIRCTGEWDNIHGVPEETLEKMKTRFQEYEGEITV